MQEVGFRLGNSTARELPGDPDPSNRPRRVAGALYSRVMPTPAVRTTLIGWAHELAGGLGVPTPPPAPLVDALGGSALITGSEPLAQRYGGHQFGQ